MTSKLSTFVLALALIVPLVPAVAGAQDDSGSDSSAASDSSEESTDKTASDGSESTDGSTEAGAEQSAEAEEASGQQASGQETDADGAEEAGADQGGEEKQQKEQAESDQSGEKKEEKQAEYGPGGRKLRKDYPGTEDSKKGQMETKRIEGLEFKEGQKPEEAYEVQIRELETKIGDLKEKVFQSKSRVVLLKETVLGGNLSGSRALIVHSDELGGRFKLQRAMYSLDGNRIYNESRKTGGLGGEKEFKIYDGSITSGSHNVSILLEYQGSGFGVFNYMKGYNFRITSSCQFEAKQGKATVLRVRALATGGAFADVSKKPGIKCELTQTDLSKEDVQASSDSEGDSESAEEPASAGDGEGDSPSSASK